LSLTDEGIRAAIEVGMELLRDEFEVKFNYYRKMVGPVSLFEVKVDDKIVSNEPVLVTPEGILTYPGFLGLIPDFSEGTSGIYFTPLDEYLKKTETIWLDREIALWDGSRKQKWDLLIKETDDYKKAWLRKDLENWVSKKPISTSVTQGPPLCNVSFVESQSEEDWMAKYEVEMSAMKKATEHYVKESFSVVDISRQNRGYDLECSRTDGILRVEVKGLRGAKYPELTQNEHRMAKFYGKSFVLFVVELSGDIKEYAVPDPIADLKVEEITKPVYRVSMYQNYKIQDIA
jgi:hypothetical protein